MTLAEFHSRLPEAASVLLKGLKADPDLRWSFGFRGLIPDVLGDELAAEWVASNGTLEVLREMLVLGSLTYRFGFLGQLLPAYHADLEKCLTSLDSQTLEWVISFMHQAYDVDWTEATNPTAARPYQSDTANLIWNLGHFKSIAFFAETSASALARWQPKTLLRLIRKEPDYLKTIVEHPDDNNVFGLNREIDDLLADYLVKSLRLTRAGHSAHDSEADWRRMAFRSLLRFNSLTNQRYLKAVLEFAAKPEFSFLNESVELLLEHRRGEVFTLVTSGLGNFASYRPDPAQLELFRLALDSLAGEGGAFLEAALASARFKYGMVDAISEILLADPNSEDCGLIRKMYLTHAAALSGKSLWEFWKLLARYDAGIFLPEWQTLAVGKSKPLRETAAAWLLAHRADEAQADTETLLASETVEGRLAGIALLGASGTPDSIERLTALHTAESSKQGRAAIAAILVKHGVSVAAEPERKPEEIGDLAAFEASLAKRAKSIRLPKAPWLDFAALPPLLSTSGSSLSPLAVTYIFQYQGRANGGEIAPEVEVLLSHLNRAANAAFAHSLLDQWFNSPMKPPDRWALDVAGITGDDSIIPRLTQPIAGWCRQNRGSRAEWAIHAISLLGTETALGVLDGLIHRYRSERKYVSEAAAAAIRNTAAALGIEDDELAERIVPDFGFDADGCRDFASSGEAVTAVLTPDFRIVWKRPDSATVSANPPSKLTAEAENEWKEIRKSLKAAVMRLATRLENSMISSRRWDITVWRDRFEYHPVFRLAAMRLIWGVYDPEGMLLRSFRLYPNNLTAGADGGLEEFAEPSASVGLVHPLELDSTAIKDWAAHLARFKVGPLFRQVDRPVHRFDPLHGNRQGIQITDQFRIKAGTLRGHFLGKGWSMGSTGDGGWIRWLFRKFPAYGIGVYLPVEEFHAASAHDQEVLTKRAFFARAAAGKQASRGHVDEAEALNFRDIPPVVYSEIMEDLTSFILTK